MGRFFAVRMPGALLAPLAAVSVLLPATAIAADDPQRPESFAAPFIDAVRSREPARRRALLHSASRACINAQTQAYYDWIFSRQARLVAGEPRVSATPIGNVPAVLPTDGQSDYPVRPSHQLQIDFTTGPTSSATLVLHVAIEQERWREVLPCPRGDVAARMRERQGEDEALRHKVKTLLQSMPAGLRAEVTALLKSGRKVDAIRRYAAASGEELVVAKAVVESLGGGEVSR